MANINKGDDESDDEEKAPVKLAMDRLHVRILLSVLVQSNNNTRLMLWHQPPSRYLAISMINAWVRKSVSGPWTLDPWTLRRSFRGIILVSSKWATNPLPLTHAVRKRRRRACTIHSCAKLGAHMSACKSALGSVKRSYWVSYVRLCYTRQLWSRLIVWCRLGTSH